MKTLKKLYSRIKPEIPSLVVLAVIIIIASRALFHPGFFRTIDDVTTVRIDYLKRELVRGEWQNNFPVRLSAELSNHYGYPLYLYYAPLVYYAGALLMLLSGVSHIVATKWVYVFPLLVGPVIFYWAARQKIGRLAALAAAGLYAFFPFRGFDTYWRGGVGEAWVMAFLPGIFGGLFLLEKKKAPGFPLTAIFVFLAMVSHNLGAMLSLGLAGLYGLIFLRKNLIFWTALILGIGLSAFFWLPSLYYLNIAKLNYSPQNTGGIFDYLLPAKAFFSVNFPIQPEDKFFGGFSYLLVFALLYYAKKIKTFSREVAKQWLFWIGSSLFLFLLLFNFTRPLWTIGLPVARLLQFSWRLWLLLSFSLPLLFGVLLNRIKGWWRYPLALVLMVLFIYGFSPAFKPKEYSFFYEYTAEDSGACATSWGDEYLPVWVEECRDKQPERDLEMTGDNRLDILKNNLIDIRAKVQGSGGELIVWRYYFPGWRVDIDGRASALDYGFTRWGIFRTVVPPGQHDVRVYYAKTTLMWVADAISLVSGAVLLTLVIKIYRQNNEKTA